MLADHRDGLSSSSFSLILDSSVGLSASIQSAAPTSKNTLCLNEGIRERLNLRYIVKIKSVCINPRFIL